MQLFSIYRGNRALDREIDDAQYAVSHARDIVEIVPALKTLLQAAENDRPGRDWQRAVCLFAFAILRFGAARERAYAPVLSQLRVASERRSAEAMAAHWLLGRISLAHAAEPGLKHDARLRHSQCAMASFKAVGRVDLKHPVLLPGIAVEYPPRLLNEDHDNSNPLTSQIVQPFRYLIATAAALIDLSQDRADTLVAEAQDHAAQLRATHPDAVAARINADLALFSAFALAGSPTSANRSGDFLLRRIADSPNLPPRKRGEWQAAAYAINVLQAATPQEVEQAFDSMEAELGALFERDYPQATPDFTRVDGIYAKAFHRRRGLEADYSEFLRNLMPGI